MEWKVVYHGHMNREEVVSPTFLVMNENERAIPK